MGWDVEKNEMYEGMVVYKDLSVNGHVYTVKEEVTSTQMQFLELLIYGVYG